MPEVLIVEDDVAVSTVLSVLLRQLGVHVRAVSSAEDAMVALTTSLFDAMVTDIRLPGMTGLELLTRATREYPDVPVVVMTAHGSVALAVEAMKRGAVDFLLKPFEPDQIERVLRDTLSRRTPSLVGPSSEPMGESLSPRMHEVHALLRKVAGSSVTVLVRGETGTGKEVVARALHAMGERRDQAFVSVHCGAIPDGLLESELFGHEKGAFTGAVARKPGRFELAHRGTLFLDEIGDIGPATQVKLVRVLQEREFERVGGTLPIKVDVRIVAATHRDLECMVRDGTFREDLFYRLNVVPVSLPPLRERSEDIETLAIHFAAVVAHENGLRVPTFDAGARRALRTFSWPGNIRQLRNIVERLVVLCEVPVIGAEQVAHELPAGQTPRSLGELRGSAEREALVSALAKAKNNRSLAARLLGVSRRTLYNKLAEHGVT
jgi:DNA-binding NtrC family response regulator